MLDWKILAASIVALLFISSFFVGGLGVRDFFSGIIDTIGDYLGTSPFGSIFPSTENEKITLGETGELSILLSPEEITFRPDGEVTVTSGDMVLNGFTGDITFSFVNGTARLQQESLDVTFPIKTTTVGGLVLGKLVLEGIPLEIKPDISTDSGDLNIQGFAGTATATADGLELKGEVSSLLITIGDLVFELVGNQ